MIWGKVKTDDELQIELRALVERIIAQQYMSTYQGERYERLLQEIYRRGLEPIRLLRPIEEKKK